MPLVFSLVFIFGLILPAFVLYEPFETDETIGWKLALVIAVAIFGFAAALFRIVASWWRTRRLVTEWQLNAVPIEIASCSLPTYRLQHEFPVFAVVGVFHPRLFIAEQVLKTLDQNEIDAVIQHELGHIAALDNLKRLALRLCSDILVAPIGRSIEREWCKAAENAADDYAVRSGDRYTALNLASALIKIARIIPSRPAPPMPAISYAVERGESLADRIRRLLQLADEAITPVRRSPRVFTPLTILLIAAVGILLADQRLLAPIHEVSEFVLTLLQ